MFLLHSTLYCMLFFFCTCYTHACGYILTHVPVTAYPRHPACLVACCVKVVQPVLQVSMRALRNHATHTACQWHALYQFSVFPSLCHSLSPLLVTVDLPGYAGHAHPGGRVPHLLRLASQRVVIVGPRPLVRLLHVPLLVGCLAPLGSSCWPLGDMPLGVAHLCVAK